MIGSESSMMITSPSFVFLGVLGVFFVGDALAMEADFADRFPTGTEGGISV